MKIMTALVLAAAAAASACAPAPSSPATPATPEVTGPDDIEIGRYLTRVGGCNDCHSVGFLESGGRLPEAEWLKGSPVGFHGPWGVTYASNLRLTVQQISEEDWVLMLGSRTDSPPMPWPVTHAMSEPNKRSLYRYIRSLGPAGEPAPPRLAPGVTPPPPYLNMTPVLPSQP